MKKNELKQELEKVLISYEESRTNAYYEEDFYKVYNELLKEIEKKDFKGFCKKFYEFESGLAFFFLLCSDNNEKSKPFFDSLQRFKNFLSEEQKKGGNL